MSQFKNVRKILLYLFVNPISRLKNGQIQSETITRLFSMTAVSYTHLDVYKRQLTGSLNKLNIFLNRKNQYFCSVLVKLHIQNYIHVDIEIIFDLAYAFYDSPGHLVTSVTHCHLLRKCSVQSVNIPL